MLNIVMDSVTYRKLYLKHNWDENLFIMVIEKNEKPECFPCPYSINFQKSHPKVESGEGFWITHEELCVGYTLFTDPNIFRPIFSYKRQRLLDEVHHGKKKEDAAEEDDSIDNPNFSYARKKYLVSIDNHIFCLNNKKIPMDCIRIILSFISDKL